MEIKDLFTFAAILLLIAILPLPYGYYIFLRLVIFAVSAYSLYEMNKQDSKKWNYQLIIFIFLFNPIFPVFLTRTIWMPIDLYGAYFFYKLSKN